jgi:EpsI family protein
MNRRACLIILLLLAAWTARVRVGTPLDVENAMPLSLFPATIGPWHGQDAALEPDVVKVAGVDDHMNRYYRADGLALGLYVGYYKSQRQGESLHSPLNCLPGTGWQPTKTETLALTIDSERTPTSISKLVVQKGLDRLLVLYWYQMFKHVTANEYLRKFFLVRDAFSSGRTDVALVRVIAPIAFGDETNEARALSAARPFAERVLPEVKKRLFRE